MKVALYLRVSTTEQADGGFSLEAQEELLRKIASAHNHQVVEVYKDVSSGKTFQKRVGYKKMMEDVEKGRFSCIMAYKLDRLHRNTANAVNFMNDLRMKSIDLILTSQGIDTSTTMGRVCFTIIAAFAELESEQTSERSQLGTEIAKKNGIICNRPKKLLTPYILNKALDLISENPKIGQNELSRNFTTISKNTLINNLCDLGLWIRGHGAIVDVVLAVKKGDTSEYIKNLEKKGMVKKEVLSDQSKSDSDVLEKGVVTNE